MKSSVVLLGLLFGVVFFAVTISARPNHSESDLSTFDEERDLDHGIVRNREHSRSGRRRRHMRQISNRYDYFSPSLYDIIRELHILREQMNELADFIKSSRTPSVPSYSGYLPQLIFMPVPMPAFGPSGSCNNSNNVPHIGGRINNDILIWGRSEKDVNTLEMDDNDEGRPISFKPVNKPHSRPSPPVEHGSIQAGLPTTSPTAAKAPKKMPGICDAAIMFCCKYSNDQQKQCFHHYGCFSTHKTGLACTLDAIKYVTRQFRDAYGPN